MPGIDRLSQVQNEIKRRANRKPVHWAWQVAMLVCAGMVLWFLAQLVYEWVDGIVALQAQVSYAKF